MKSSRGQSESTGRQSKPGSSQAGPVPAAVNTAGLDRPAPRAACRCGRRLRAKDSGRALGPVDDRACCQGRRQRSDLTGEVERRRHQRRAGKCQPGATGRTGAALLIGSPGNFHGISGLVGLRRFNGIRRSCALAGFARRVGFQRRVAGMPVRSMRRLWIDRQHRAMGLRGQRAMVAWAEMQHGGCRHSLRGNGKHHKPDQDGSEQSPHASALQQLP